MVEGEIESGCPEVPPLQQQSLPQDEFRPRSKGRAELGELQVIVE